MDHNGALEVLFQGGKKKKKKGVGGRVNVGGGAVEWHESQGVGPGRSIEHKRTQSGWMRPLAQAPNSGSASGAAQ